MNFIEQLFGFVADNDSGMLELLLVLIPGFAMALWILRKAVTPKSLLRLTTTGKALSSGAPEETAPC